MFINANQEIISTYQENQSQEVLETRNKVSELSNQNASVLFMFDSLINAMKPELSKDALQTFLDAIAYSAEKHQSQTRKDKDKTPYIIHPMGVALSLFEEGLVRDQDAILAALLHDTLEDTDATKEEIASLFGSNVAEIVESLSNPSGLTPEEAKAWQIDHAPYLSREARLVKLADRLYNVRDLKTGPVGWDEEKIENYYGWGQKLLDVLKGTNPNLETLLQAEIDSR